MAKFGRVTILNFWDAVKVKVEATLTQNLSPPVEVHGRRIPIERVCGVGVGQQLWQERLEDVGEIVEGRPGLVDDVEANRAGHLVNIRVVNLEANNFLTFLFILRLSNRFLIPSTFTDSPSL